MARVNNPLLEGFKGRLGNTIFYKNGKQAFVRSTPEKYRDANTPLQQIYRKRLTVAVRFYQQLAETTLREVWRQEGRRLKTNGYALFMRENINAFTPEGKIGDFSLLHLGAGNLVEANLMRATLKEDNEVLIEWENPTSLPQNRLSDRLVVVILYSHRSFSPVVLNELLTKREDEKVSFRLHRHPGVKAHLYCFFASRDEQHFSNDKYFCL